MSAKIQKFDAVINYCSRFYYKIEGNLMSVISIFTKMKEFQCLNDSFYQTKSWFLIQYTTFYILSIIIINKHNLVQK
ncbi:hypothetical protein EMIT036CA2_20374 [Chryseobacterium sp. IT-36CA2]